MFNKSLTIFNFHADTKTWYMSVVTNATIDETYSSSPSTRGSSNGNNVDVLIPSDVDGAIRTTKGFKQYLTPNEYSRCKYPAKSFTFNTETDFIYLGAFKDLEPVNDELFLSGLYNQMNEDYQGVFKVSYAFHVDLLPHYEVGGA